MMPAQTFNYGRATLSYVMVPFLASLTDVAILLLRLMVGLIFFTSGWAHVTKSEERSKSIEMSKGFTIVLGIVECLGALGVIFGVLTQWAAIGLILVMLGAMQKKIFKWKISFWGKGTDGWSYEVMMILMNFVIATTAGGRFTLENLFH
jgi:putative oxidoreductase